MLKCPQLPTWVRRNPSGPCAAASSLAPCAAISSLNLDESRAFCESRGARLCSVSELTGGVAIGTGCDESLAVWSSEFCGDRPDRATRVRMDERVPLENTSDCLGS